MKEWIVQKLTSRKLWIAVIGIVVGLAATFGIEENEYVQIAGIVGSICSGIAYIIGEATIDAASKVEIIEAVTDKIEGEDNVG